MRLSFKKAIACLMCAGLMLVAFTGCDQNSVKTLIAAVEKTNALNSAQCSMDMKMKLEVEGQSMEIPMTATTSFAKKDEKYTMAMDMQMQFMGMDMSTKNYYSDGYMYTEMAGNKVKTALALEEAEAQSVSVMSLDETMVKSFETENTDAGTKYTLVLDDTKATDFLQELITKNAALSSGTPNAQYSFSNLQMHYVVDKQGYASEQWVAFDAEINMEVEGQGSVSSKCGAEITINFVNPGTDVEITLPEDLDSYSDASTGAVA